MAKSSLEEVEETMLIKEEEMEMKDIVLSVKELTTLWILNIRSMDTHQIGEEVQETLMLIWLMEKMQKVKCRLHPLVEMKKVQESLLLRINIRI